jgi:RNA polymerase sigma-70 factor (ECF subfamily)
LSRSQAKAAAFVALLQPLQRPLEVYCRRMLRNPAWVEDVIQAAVAEAYARFDRFTEGTNFRAWMFRFVTHEIFNRNRKRGPALWGERPVEAPTLPPDGPDAEDLFAELLDGPDGVLEHFDGPLADALGQLPAPERAVLLLRAVGEFSYEEIHDLLSIPLGSVMGYLSRARLKLRRSLAGYAAERGFLVRRSSPGEGPCS